MEYGICFISSDYYIHFVLGECILENYIKDNNSSAELISSIGKEKLSEAERHLKNVLKENEKVRPRKNMCVSDCMTFKIENESRKLILFC